MATLFSTGMKGPQAVDRLNDLHEIYLELTARIEVLESSIGVPTTSGTSLVFHRLMIPST